MKQISALRVFALAFLACAATATEPAESEELAADHWVEPMREVHERFTGEPGTFAQFGDSITISMAYWAPVQHTNKGADEQTSADLQLIRDYMDERCWRGWKGSQYGNNGRMTIRWAHENVDKWLEQLNPEVALIMFGTNDLHGVDIEEYEEKCRTVIRKCLANGTVVILQSIPPRHGMAEKSADYADVTRRLSRELHVPLSDFHAEVLRRRPDDWSGKDPSFKDVPGGTYDVPTLIARDGVHPSNPKKYRDFSEQSLRHNGFVLRNWLSAQAYATVIRRILQPR